MRLNVAFVAYSFGAVQSIVRSSIAHGAFTTSTARTRHQPSRREGLVLPQMTVSAGDANTGDIKNEKNMGATEGSRTPHAARAWEHWRALGSPRYVVAPMVDG